ncbi:MAG: phosphoadenosine phosphosulfate reductase family protein [Desulfurococcaceae archaeon]
MRWAWPRTVKIYWDPWNNVPVIKPRQEEIDLLYQLRLGEPGDARPAFRGDLEKLKVAVKYEFGDEKLYFRLIEGKFVLLNKIPHWDVMYEVVSSGNVVGQLYYDPYSSMWRFRLTYQGACIAVQENIIDTIKCKPPIYTGKVLAPRISTSSRQVVVVDEKYDIRGIGEVSSDGVVLVKAFHDRSLPVETSNKPATIHDVLNRNSEGLELMEEKAIRYLKRLQSRFGGASKPVVSYSGGKDSLVALDLAHRAYGDLDMVFNDTGLELPETLKNVKEVAEFYGYKLHIASAGDIFWKAVEVFGPPGKDYRWCCKVAKLVPIAKLTKTLWPGGAFNIVGQRAYESLDRAKSPLIWRNRWIPHMVSTSPVQYWSQLACWLYVFKYKLPYNKLYEEGFNRLGCYLCPSCALAEFEDTKRIYPDLWSTWEAVLERWREKLNMPPEWIRLGLWRWLSPATAKTRVAHRLPGYIINWKEEYSKRLEENSIGLKPVEAVVTGNSLLVKFSRDLFSEKLGDMLIENLISMGFKRVCENPLTFEKNNAVFEIQGNYIKVLPYNEHSFEDLVDVIKIVYRMKGCVFCGSCVLWTGRGLVKLTLKGPIALSTLDDKNARVYIEVCPISDQLVEKVVAPLITNDHKSFKRKTRRKPLL